MVAAVGPDGEDLVVTDDVLSVRQRRFWPPGRRQ
jgi:hypothetical protein